MKSAIDLCSVLTNLFIYLITILENVSGKGEIIYEEIMAENFPDLIKTKLIDIIQKVNKI